jgi:hypothetical protein
VTRAAASSIARGRPSSRMQISATGRALAASRTKSGRAACARCTHNATASNAATWSNGGSCVGSGRGSSGNGYSHSPRRCSGVRLVTRAFGRRWLWAGGFSTLPAPPSVALLVAGTTISTLANLDRPERPETFGSPWLRAAPRPVYWRRSGSRRYGSSGLGSSYTAHCVPTAVLDQGRGTAAACGSSCSLVQRRGMGCCVPHCGRPPALQPAQVPPRRRNGDAASEAAAVLSASPATRKGPSTHNRRLPSRPSKATLTER